jgi:hypothetical protein
MATSYVTVKGKVKWAQVYEPDDYAGSTRFILNFYPSNGEEWDKLRKSGIQVQPKMDNEEGSEYVRIRRDVKRVIKDEVVFFCPPAISGAFEVHYENENGDKITSYEKGTKIKVVGEQKPLGNGTVVLANICVFDTAKGKGHRLESLKVLDHVVYERPAEAAEEAAPAKEEKKKPAPKKKEEANDEPW